MDMAIIKAEKALMNALCLFPEVKVCNVNKILYYRVFILKGFLAYNVENS
jgi:hypothetical protein